MSNIKAVGLIFVFLACALAGCGPSEDDIHATETRIVADVLATQTAGAPTATRTPTDTPVPTATPTLTPTAAPAVTNGGEAQTGSASGEGACNDPLGCVYIAAGDPIHIGYMLTISGATSFLGLDSRGGVEIAIADRGGELLGHPIRLTGRDSGCSTEKGQTAAEHMVQDTTLLGIIGTNCTNAALAALPMISEAGLVMISPSNTAPSMTDPDGFWMPGYYRTVHNDRWQGALAARFAFEVLGARSAATVQDGSAFAFALQDAFSAVFLSLGGSITSQASIQQDPIIASLLGSLSPEMPDVLYFPIFEPEGPALISLVRGYPGLENTFLIAADGLLVNSFPENAGENVVGAYLTGPFVSGPAYDALLESWDALIGTVPPSGFHAHAYDAANLLLNAIEQVADIDNEGGLLVGRAALREALTETENYPGILGALTCTMYGDCGTDQALAVFEITEAELNGNWPPPVIYQP